jgi:dTMP kinase
MLKVYFTASTSFNGEFKNNYRKIIKEIQKNKVQLISGEQIISETLLLKDQKLAKEEIFLRQKKLIEAADCIIAEVTKPSLGVGSEVVYGLTKEIPVLGLVFEDEEDKISPMIAGNRSDNFFLEHYQMDNLNYRIKEFLNHIQTIKKRKGILIVIDGGDGSGKATQANLLIKKLREKKIPVKYFDFPRYYQSFHGQTVARFLRGEFGTIDQVSPYLASLAYALDRASAKQEMDDFLKKGGIIITNRYISSSMAYQGAKFNSENEQKEFLKWIYDLEYKVHRLPKENLVIYLYVPWQTGFQLTLNKEKRRYLKGQALDIHEKDMAYRQKVEAMYLDLAKKNKNWEVINCVENDQILPKEVIHQKIIELLGKKFGVFKSLLA